MKENNWRTHYTMAERQGSWQSECMEDKILHRNWHHALTQPQRSLSWKWHAHFLSNVVSPIYVHFLLGNYIFTHFSPLLIFVCKSCCCNRVIWTCCGKELKLLLSTWNHIVQRYCWKFSLRWITFLRHYARNIMLCLNTVYFAQFELSCILAAVLHVKILCFVCYDI